MECPYRHPSTEELKKQARFLYHHFQLEVLWFHPCSSVNLSLHSFSQKILIDFLHDTRGQYQVFWETFIWPYLGKRNQKWPKKRFYLIFVKKCVLIFLKIAENERLRCYCFLAEIWYLEKFLIWRYSSKYSCPITLQDSSTCNISIKSWVIVFRFCM